MKDILAWAAFAELSANSRSYSVIVKDISFGDVSDAVVYLTGLAWYRCSKPKFWANNIWTSATAVIWT